MGISQKWYIAKTRFFGLHFCHKQYRLIFNLFDVTDTRASKFGKITQNKGHHAVQGHSRSPILVSIESPYATSYEWLILTYILSCTISKLLQIIGQICTFDRRYVFNTVVQGEPLNSGPWSLALRKLEESLYRISLSQSMHLTDTIRETDRWTVSSL